MLTALFRGVSVRQIGRTEGERAGQGGSAGRVHKMATVATAELIGQALDYAAACAEAKKGQHVHVWVGANVTQVQLEWVTERGKYHCYDPSINYAIVGRYIEKERISVVESDDGDGWVASAWGGPNNPPVLAFGETHLIAVTRCFVRRRFGESVEVPEILLADMYKPRGGAAASAELRSRGWQ